MVNRTKSPSKTTNKKLVAVAGAGIVATAVGIGGYSLGIATSDGLRVTKILRSSSNFICAYMKKQVEIKNNYNLTVTAEEKVTFKKILQTNCIVSDN